MALSLKQLEAPNRWAWAMRPEAWRAVPGLGGRYEASSYGRVRRAAGGRRAEPGRVLAGSLTARGYRTLKPYPRPDRRVLSVHRMVAWAFLGPQPTGIEVNHIDCDPGHNAVWNLEYVTPSQNVRHAVQNGRLDRRGTRNGRAVLDEGAVRTIRAAYAAGGVSYPTLAKRHGVSKHTIAEVVRGEKWRHI